ncbi:leucyl/phenylalanyl-tRNA--protein transferase [Hyphomicrobium sp. CS1GBMeth3]|uniref:leucyl/phenylalanyl-tRNA--protein transferase n=1 Tax=Hyphomicrobium sp. CS1GBMeth3 TaxID=1892845 RepID=UPI0009305FD7|nr:leucyl/phenylalanyl-tRNA--protein transferase [Hyphomicrobium sp. CS1GBMeth3]
MGTAILVAGTVVLAAGSMVAALLLLRARRDGKFAESPAFTVQRWTLGTLYSLRPVRIADLPDLLWHSAVDIVRGGTRVPDPACIKACPDSFGGVARDVSPATVLAAAERGFFPWCHFGPLKWWTREQRMVLATADFRMTKNLRRIMRKAPHRVTFDQAFDDVIRCCAGRRKNRLYGLTWITPTIMRLYSELHRQGHAHSFEVWNADGVLVGGGYGLSVGRVFFTESQFSHESNASKMGFATLMYHLARWGYVANDGKDPTPTLEEAGFRLMPRRAFEAVLEEHGTASAPTRAWTVSAPLSEIAEWDASSAKTETPPQKPAQPRRPPRIKSAA